jgi:UDP-N-acetylmuramoylalanine--D-glutamate ligase
MSSHQLEYIKESPHIAAILNLYQDHLDHSGTLEHYHNNKMNIFKYQSNNDFLIYSSDNEYLNNKMTEYDYKAVKYNVRFDNEKFLGNDVRIIDKDVFINNELVYTDTERKLLGDHNLKNIMFVLTIAKLLNLDLVKAKETIKEFNGLKYRMEYIGKYNNIHYYNDTIATIPDATINAVKAIKNVDTLIFGGMDRKIDYSEFIEFLKTSEIKNLICMPTTGTNIGKLLEETNKNILYVETLEEAYVISKENTEKGKICLLSPAAASYEFYRNFEEKGERFAELVMNDGK